MSDDSHAHMNLAGHRARWGDAVDPGLLIVPGVLLKYQRQLGLMPVDVLVILNLVELWDEGEDMPSPRLSVLADRIGCDARTIQRTIQKLERADLLRRLPNEIRKGRTIRRFDLTGLRARLVTLSKQTPKALRRRASAAA